MSNELSLYPAKDEWAMMKEQAQMLIHSKMLPSSIQTPHAAIAIMLKGRELQLPPMMAFNHIHIIKGKPTLSAEVMLALIFKKYPQTDLTYAKNDDTACEIHITKNGKLNKFSFTIEDAIKAELLGNPTWKKYPRAMLRSRCISEMSRSLFPEALMGCSYTREEMESIDITPQKNVRPEEVTPMPEEDIPKTINFAFPEHFEVVKFVFEKFGIDDHDERKSIAKMALDAEIHIGDFEKFLKSLKGIKDETPVGE